MLHSTCQQIWKTWQWPQDWKRSVFIAIPKKGKPKKVQTTVQMRLFHMLIRFCSKSFKVDFISTWAENFQMYKLHLEKAEEPEIKSPAFVGSWRRQGNSRKQNKTKHTYFFDYVKAFDCVDHNKLLKILTDMGIPDHLTCLLRNLYADQEAIVRTKQGAINWFKFGKGTGQICMSLWLFNFYADSIIGNGGLDDLQTGIKIP